jgi:hypothetical protein
MLISTALLLDSNIRNSVCTPAKLPCRRVVEGSEKSIFVWSTMQTFYTNVKMTLISTFEKCRFLDSNTVRNNG